MVRPRTSRSWYRLGALALFGALIPLTACGGGGDDVEAGSTTTQAAAGPSGGGTTGTFEDQAFAVGQKFWHAGFLVELGDGTYYAVVDEGPFAKAPRYFVSIDATFENLGEDSTRLSTEAALTAGGDVFEPSSESDIPTVPGGLSADGTFVFEVNESVDIASATLIVGSGDERRSKIPLGSDAGELVTVEPRDVDLTGRLSVELLDLELTSAELRADRPVQHTQVGEDELALTLEFDAVSRKSGNWTIRANDFALTLPDGSSVVPEGSALEPLPGSDEGISTSGLSLVFVVEDPTEGDYALRFKVPSWFEGDDGITEDTVEFTLD
jgi:hypothetical protein